MSKKTEILGPNGIHTLDKVNLNGLEQWILIRSWDQSNPVLLYLHGGPGAPLFCNARDIGFRTSLEHKFTMVYWEQRGTGKSFSLNIPEKTMTVEQLISDTHELTLMLLERLKVQKILLVGKSFGSLIGILTVNKFPELYSAYVGIGQIVYPLKSDSISYEYTLELAKKFEHEEALAELSKIGYPPYRFDETLLLSKWLTKFDQMILNRKFNKKPVKYYYKLLSTPEYTLIDIFKMGIDPYFSLRNLWDENIYKINIPEKIQTIDVPVFFIAGRHDYFVSSQLAEKFYHKLTDTKGKYFIWFEQSSHEPELDEPNKFRSVFFDQVYSVIKGY